MTSPDLERDWRVSCAIRAPWNGKRGPVYAGIRRKELWEIENRQERRKSGRGVAYISCLGDSEHGDGCCPGPEQKQPTGAQGKSCCGDVIKEQNVAALNQISVAHPDRIKVDLQRPLAAPGQFPDFRVPIQTLAGVAHIRAFLT